MILAAIIVFCGAVALENGPLTIAGAGGIIALLLLG
jgi:hypothetical protein